jgi:hypothetical protein
LKNAEIAKDNAAEMAKVATENDKLMDAYRTDLSKYRDLIKVESNIFEAERLQTIKEVSALRIQVDSRFQPIVDELLGKSKED